MKLDTNTAVGKSVKAVNYGYSLFCEKGLVVESNLVAYFVCIGV